MVAHCKGYGIERTEFVAELSLLPADKPRALLD